MTKQSRPDLDSKTPEIKTEKRKAVGGDCKESNIEGKSARKYSRRWDIRAGSLLFDAVVFPVFIVFLFAAELDTAYRG